MTYGNPAAPVQQQSTSKACLWSLICGVLGCLPFVTGLLAVVLGFVGIANTGNPQKTGRWMGVVGLILGLISIVSWGGVSLLGGGILAIFSMTQAPAIAAHDFIRDLTAGDIAACKAHSTGLTDEEIDGLSVFAKAHGTFKDTTFNNRSIVNDEAGISGTAEFSGGTVNVEATLKKDGGIWKVMGLRLKN